MHGKRVYGNVFIDRIADVYNGPAYQEMRQWLLRSAPDTWCPAVARHCPLRVTPTREDQDIGNCRVKVLRLEPVTYCNLHCPVCPVEVDFKQVSHLRETRAQKLLPLETMLDVVAQLPDLERIEYFGYGEPFLHNDTISFLREVRRTRPGVQIETNTSGMVMTPAQINAIAAEALMDRVVFSIDGATPESYRKYRVGGSFSKTFGKMASLVEACRTAGTWRKYGDDRFGRVQITWQYILFEWNDSDEELALACELARNMNVPIEWVLTSGYGASKRFRPGSAEVARFMDPPDSFIHMSANAEIDYRLDERAIRNIHFYRQIHGSCVLLSLPYIKNDERLEYQVRFHINVPVIVAPVGSTVLFNINVENKTDQGWNPEGSDFLRLGFLLKTMTGEKLGEVAGVILPRQVARPGGRDTIRVPVNLPADPGKYKLLVDVVQESVCWFHNRGSPPFICTLRVN